MKINNTRNVCRILTIVRTYYYNTLDVQKKKPQGKNVLYVRTKIKHLRIFSLRKNNNLDHWNCDTKHKRS